MLFFLQSSNQMTEFYGISKQPSSMSKVKHGQIWYNVCFSRTAKCSLIKFIYFQPPPKGIPRLWALRGQTHVQINLWTPSTLGDLEQWYPEKYFKIFNNEWATVQTYQILECFLLHTKVKKKFKLPKQKAFWGISILWSFPSSGEKHY